MHWFTEQPEWLLLSTGCAADLTRSIGWKAANKVWIFSVIRHTIKTRATDFHRHSQTLADGRPLQVSHLIRDHCRTSQKHNLNVCQARFSFLLAEPYLLWPSFFCKSQLFRQPQQQAYCIWELHTVSHNYMSYYVKCMSEKAALYCITVISAEYELDF